LQYPDTHPANLEGRGRLRINTENAMGIKVISLQKPANRILMIELPAARRIARGAIRELERINSTRKGIPLI
jgi:hypothetical protein